MLQVQDNPLLSMLTASDPQFLTRLAALLAPQKLKGFKEGPVGEEDIPLMSPPAPPFSPAESKARSGVQPGQLPLEAPTPLTRMSPPPPPLESPRETLRSRLLKSHEQPGPFALDANDEPFSSHPVSNFNFRYQAAIPPRRNPPRRNPPLPMARDGYTQPLRLSPEERMRQDFLKVPEHSDPYEVADEQVPTPPPMQPTAADQFMDKMRQVQEAGSGALRVAGDIAGEYGKELGASGSLPYLVSIPTAIAAGAAGMHLWQRSRMRKKYFDHAMANFVRSGSRVGDIEQFDLDTNRWQPVTKPDTKQLWDQVYREVKAGNIHLAPNGQFMKMPAVEPGTTEARTPKDFLKAIQRGEADWESMIPVVPQEPLVLPAGMFGPDVVHSLQPKETPRPVAEPTPLGTKGPEATSPISEPPVPSVEPNAEWLEHQRGILEGMKSQGWPNTPKTSGETPAGGRSGLTIYNQNTLNAAPASATPLPAETPLSPSDIKATPQIRPLGEPPIRGWSIPARHEGPVLPVKPFDPLDVVGPPPPPPPPRKVPDDPFEPPPPPPDDDPNIRPPGDGDPPIRPPDEIDLVRPPHKIMIEEQLRRRINEDIASGKTTWKEISTKTGIPENLGKTWLKGKNAAERELLLGHYEGLAKHYGIDPAKGLPYGSPEWERFTTEGVPPDGPWNSFGNGQFTNSPLPTKLRDQKAFLNRYGYTGDTPKTRTEAGKLIDEMLAGQGRGRRRMQSPYAPLAGANYDPLAHMPEPPPLPPRSGPVYHMKPTGEPSVPRGGGQVRPLEPNVTALKYKGVDFSKKSPAELLDIRDDLIEHQAPLPEGFPKNFLEKNPLPVAEMGPGPEFRAAAAEKARERRLLANRLRGALERSGMSQRQFAESHWGNSGRARVGSLVLGNRNFDAAEINLLEAAEAKYPPGVQQPSLKPTRSWENNDVLFPKSGERPGIFRPGSGNLVGDAVGAQPRPWFSQTGFEEAMYPPDFGLPLEGEGTTHEYGSNYSGELPSGLSGGGGGSRPAGLNSASDISTAAKSAKVERFLKNLPPEAEPWMHEEIRKWLPTFDESKWHEVADGVQTIGHKLGREGYFDFQRKLQEARGKGLFSPPKTPDNGPPLPRPQELPNFGPEHIPPKAIGRAIGGGIRKTAGNIEAFLQAAVRGGKEMLGTLSHGAGKLGTVAVIADIANDIANTKRIHDPRSLLAYPGGKFKETIGGMAELPVQAVHAAAGGISGLENAVYDAMYPGRKLLPEGDRWTLGGLTQKVATNPMLEFFHDQLSTEGQRLSKQAQDDLSIMNARLTERPGSRVERDPQTLKEYSAWLEANYPLTARLKARREGTREQIPNFEQWRAMTRGQEKAKADEAERAAAERSKQAAAATARDEALRSRYKNQDEVAKELGSAELAKKYAFWWKSEMQDVRPRLTPQEWYDRVYRKKRLPGIEKILESPAGQKLQESLKKGSSNTTRRTLAERYKESLMA